MFRKLQLIRIWRSIASYRRQNVDNINHGSRNQGRVESGWPGLSGSLRSPFWWVKWVSSAKFYYLDVTQIFNRSHVLWKKTLASDKWVNLGSGECTSPSLVWNRVESGSYLLTHFTHWPTKQYGYDPLVTHMLKFSF